VFAVADATSFFEGVLCMQLPPEMHGQLFKQAQAYLGKQGNSVDDLKSQGFDVSGLFGKFMGKG